MRVTKYLFGQKEIKMELLKNYICIDVETTGLHTWEGHKIFAVAAVWPDGKIRFWRDDFEGLKELCEDLTIAKVFHNAAFDVGMLKAMGIEVKGAIFDTMLFGWCLHSSWPQNLDFMCRQYLPPRFAKVVDELNQWFDEHKIPKSKRGLSFNILPPELLKKRVVGDAASTCALFKVLFEKVMSQYGRVCIQEHRLLPITSSMVQHGLMINAEEIKRQEGEIMAQLEEIYEYFYGIMGEGFIPTSPKHIRDLFVKTGLDGHCGRTASGMIATDSWSLRQIHHPISANLLAMRGLEKRLNTFVRPLREEAVDDIIHPNFRQTGTATGRYSCAKPNMMNVPSESERMTTFSDEEAAELEEWAGTAVASHIHKLIRCRPGYCHIHSDKSKVEVAMFAHYAKDEILIQALKEGKDIHSEICKLLFGEETKGKRVRSKAIIFGKLYGAGARVIARNAACSLEEAQNLIALLDARMPALKGWSAQLTRQIRTTGYVETDFGNRYYIAPQDSYKAVNYMCQGTAALEVKSRMIALTEAFRERGWENDVRVIVQVHDDIGVEAPIELFPEVAPLMHQIMEETSMEYRVPLPASLEATVTNWGELQKIDPKNPILPGSKI
jgi:DNA polymerase-1